MRFGQDEEFVTRAEFSFATDADELGFANEECDPRIVAEFVEVTDLSLVGDRSGRLSCANIALQSHCG